MLQRVGTSVVGWWLVICGDVVPVTFIALHICFLGCCHFGLSAHKPCQSFDPPTLDHKVTMQVVECTRIM